MEDRHAGHFRAGALTRRRFIKMSAAAGLGAAAAPWLSSLPFRADAATKLSGTVDFLGWGGHKEDAQIKDFFDKTGAKVNFIGFAENADALTKVKLEGGKKYDIVAIDALWVPKYHELGLLEPVDLKSWPVHKDLFDEFKDIKIWRAGSQTLSVPWGWSPMVVWYNPKHVTGNPTSWEVLFDKKYAKRITFERQPVDVIAYMGVATGAKHPYAMTKSEIAQAKDALRRLKPNILKFFDDTGDLAKSMADESVWFAVENVGIGGRVKAAGGPELKSFLPKEGYIGYYDGDSLVKGAADRDAAIAWIQDKAQAQWVAMNFLRAYRPLAWKSGYDLLVKQGKRDLAKAAMYDRPELAMKMVVKGPPPNIGEYVDAFNEVMS
jgi:spermidine/putrescine transport system substrate-binding protein